MTFIQIDKVFFLFLKLFSVKRKIKWGHNILSWALNLTLIKTQKSTGNHLPILPNF